LSMELESSAAITNSVTHLPCEGPGRVAGEKSLDLGLVLLPSCVSEWSGAACLDSGVTAATIMPVEWSGTGDSSCASTAAHRPSPSIATLMPHPRLSMRPVFARTFISLSLTQETEASLMQVCRQTRARLWLNRIYARQKSGKLISSLHGDGPHRKCRHI